MRAPIAPATTAKTLARSFIDKFNVGRNDNKAFSGWSGQLWTTRTVLGIGESRKIIAEVKKLPAAKQKAVLNAIAARIDKKAATVGGMYITPQGVKAFEKLASSLGLKTQFDGIQRPPMVMGYSMDDIDNLVDDILEKCVEGYKRPKRKPKSRPVVVKDGFEQSAPGVEPHGRP